MISINYIYENDSKLKKTLQEELLKFKNRSILLQIFSGDLNKSKIIEIIKTIKSSLPNIKIIGSTTDGEIIDGKVTEKKIILSFSIFENTKIETKLFEKKENSFDLGQKIAYTLVKENTKALICFADGLNINGEELLNGINSVSSIIVAGGLAGDNGEFKETFVFTQEGFLSNGCAVATLNSDVLRVNNNFGFNWEGIGKIMTVTKADANRVYEIDNIKAAEIYRHYFGDVAKDVVKIGVEFPLIINKYGLKIARAVLAEYNDGSLLFAGNLNVGDKVQFGYGNVEAILKKDENLLNEMTSYDIESIFVYSCMARRRFLGKKIKYEIKPLKQFGKVAGFFTYGEFFTKQNNYVFFNQTMTLLVLSEKENKKNINIKFDFKQSSLRTLRALTNLIKATSDELIQLNKNLEEKVSEKTKELIEKNKKLEYVYYHDNLTNLPNKFKFEEDLNKKDAFGCVLIDIMKFSTLNDFYGEKIGDEVLKKFSGVLSKIAKKYNCKLYRMSGDQFIIVSFKDNSINDIIKNEIFERMETPITVEIDNNTISLELDVRIALVKEKYNDMKLKADLALNYAKRNNLDFVEYDNSLNLEEKLQKELKIIDMVKKAIEEDRIIPVFQKIKKENNDTYECLVRIKQENKLISPFVFLEIIKPTSYYYEITKIMIEKSFKIFQNKDEMISLNFSYKDIENEEIVNFLLQKINEYNMKGRVIIEILESENIRDFQKILKFINIIKDLGVQIAIDDFGSGYSNFIYLAEIKPDYIKIDGSLIKKLMKIIIHI